MGARVEERQSAIGALLQTIVEQFAERSGHRPEDIRQFERLAGDLIDIAENDCVAAVAKTLCLHLETPKSLIARLFRRGGACARVAFEFAPMAPVSELVVNAEHGAPELAAAIARRPDLSRELVAALSARAEPDVLRALAANRLLRLDRGALRALMQAARDDLVLARVLLDRDDLDLDPEPLFLAATAAERSAILLASCRLAMLTPAADMGAEGRRFLRAGAGLATLLLDLAVRQCHDAMVTVVADALDARKSRVRKIFEDEGGEAPSLAFVALGMDVDTATKIFLCGERSYGRDAARLRELRALMRSAPTAAAARIVAAMTGAARFERDGPRKAQTRDEAPQALAWRRPAAPKDAGRLRVERKA